jgi:DNA-binding response OmpR family regulator
MPRIAIVEDDPDLALFISDLLSEEGYQVASYTETRTTYEAILHERPDAVVLDVHMGLLWSGIHVLEAIQANPDTADIPIIICTADRIFLEKHHADLIAKGCEVLQKPFDIDTLITLVSKCIEKSEAKQAKQKIDAL